jgi:hypothetical protein
MRIPLKLEILRSGKSQRKLSRETEISEDRLSEIVNGWIDPRDDERRRLTEALGCSSEVFDDQATIETRRHR